MKEVLSKIKFNLKSLFLPCPENNYKPKFLEKNLLAGFIIILIFLKLLIIPVFVIFPENIFFADISKIALFNLINEEREKKALSPLMENPLLTQAAELKSRDMFEFNYFQHISPSGVTPWHWFKKVGYNYETAGENLAIGFLDSEEVYKAWIDSPSHRDNLFNSNYQEIGIAVISGNFEGNKTSIVVQTFGSPKKEVIQKETQMSPDEETEKIEKLSLPAGKTEEETKEIKQTAQKTGEIKGTEFNSGLSSHKEEKVVALGFNFWRFMATSYYYFAQKFIFAALLFIVFLLMINVLVKISVQSKSLILKTMFFILILSIFYFLDKQFIIQIIPHDLNVLQRVF